MVLTEEGRKKLGTMVTAPYMKLATFLISKPRKMVGNQFRHQCETRTILIDYGYIDSVLHKAALIHDILEEIPDFNRDLIRRNADSEGPQVLDLVLEVTRKQGETKADFLTRLFLHGSLNARTLKAADRISNMKDLGLVSDPDFIERYCTETEEFVFPIAAKVDRDMLRELDDLVKSRRAILPMLRNQPAAS